MIPLSDDNPRNGTFPFVTVALIGICIAVFLYQIGLPAEYQQAFTYFYGAVPAEIMGRLPGQHTDNGYATGGYLSILTSMFMHGGVAHIAGNMLYLWIFGDNVEIAMGKIRYLIFYLLTGTIAALTHAYFDPTSQIPMVGASGAISGVLGAYLMLFPKANVKMLLILGFFWRLIHVPAFLVLGLWFLFQFFGIAAVRPGEGGVAVLAHVGGFIAGMILVHLFIRKDEHLFHSQKSKPWEMQKAAIANLRKPRPWDGQ
ncbi:MAG: rhomboid family intramembrane serine protease [Proteobacteria bacterium]|nr:rhomboid family intramembrane serine protease [Pseudomonadota bacterium]